MKKVALLLAAAICLGACHCERKTTGTQCRKAACQAAQLEAERARQAELARQRAEAARQRAAEQAAALAAVGAAEQTGNVISFKYKNPILFATNSDKIIGDSNKEIDATANVLKRYPGSKVTVHGYTDSTGNADYNLDLSERRAKAVAEALTARGASNVSYVGHGIADPIADNKTAAGRAQNRRVELQIEVVE